VTGKSNKIPIKGHLVEKQQDYTSYRKKDPLVSNETFYPVQSTHLPLKAWKDMLSG